MNALKKKIEDALAHDDAAGVELPPELLARLVKEIPEQLTIADVPSSRRTPSWRAPVVGIAASLLIVGSLAVMTRRTLDSPAPAPPEKTRTATESKHLDSVPPAAALAHPSALPDARRRDDVKASRSAGEKAERNPRPSALGETRGFDLDLASSFAGAPRDTKAQTFEGAVTSYREAPRPPTAEHPPVRAEVVVSAELPEVDTTRASSAAAFNAEELPVARSFRTVAQTSASGGKSPIGGSPSFENGYKMSGATPSPSTGGTHEPNDQPYGDTFFRTTGVNPFVDTDDETKSTFGLEVDTGSYNVAKRYLTDGHLPPPEAIRVEEFLNAFKYGDAAPRRGDFALYAEGVPSPRGPEYRYVRFGVRAREVSAAERKPATLVFCVDVSGSMAQENRLGLVKKALGLLLDGLRKGDRIGLVVFGSNARVLLPMTGDREAIREAIDRLVPEGSTNTEEGLFTAYRMAEGNFDARTSNRVILCSDGVANVGRTGPDSILERIGAAARKGIELTTVGFGMGNYNDQLMEQLANKGDGRYAYVDTPKEAERLFVEELTGTLQTIGVNARVQVAFDPKVVSRFRLVGYENRAIANERFRDDTVDAGEIGAGHAVTALYEVKLQKDVRSGDVAKLTLRWRPEARKDFTEADVTLRLGDVASSWEGGAPGAKLAVLVSQLAETLKETYWAKDASLTRTLAGLRLLRAAEGVDARVGELAGLVETAARLKAAKAAAPAVTPAAVTPED